MNQEKKSEISRDMIIQAAIQEFCVHGFQGASIRRICKESGITNGRLFHYFKTKADLYLACAESYFRILSEYMQRFELDVAENFEQNAVRLHTHWQNFWRIHPETDKLFIQLRINPPPEIANELLAARRQTFIRSMKLILRDMLTFFYPGDPEMQSFLTGVWLSVLDFTVVGVGLQKVDLYPDMESWLSSQEKMFKKLLRAFLYGANSEEFAELRQEQFSGLEEEPFPKQGKYGI